MQSVICTNKECFKTFDVSIQTEETDKGYIQVFFKCPHCKEQYNCYKENQYTLSLQDQINNITYRLSLVCTKAARKNLSNRYKELRKAKKKVLEKINGKNIA